MPSQVQLDKRAQRRDLGHQRTIELDRADALGRDVDSSQLKETAHLAAGPKGPALQVLISEV